MSDIKIAAIMRAGAYSPNHIGNDAAILNATSDQLRKRGYEVKIYTEEQLCRDGVSEPVIINMCREQESLALLQTYENEGRLVVNSGFGIANCIRERMARLLLAHGIAYPESMIVDTDEVVKTKLSRAGFSQCWIKRGDSYSRHKEDVSYVRHPEEAQEVLQEYFLRGIRRAVINRHLTGDLVKFYGVSGSPFFYWFYPFESGYSKPSDEKGPAEQRQPRFSLEELRGMCNSAAEILNIRVWGGNCIVSPEGEMTIIDFNDWPSFAPCRQEASVSIAKAVIADIKKDRGSLTK